MFIPESCMNFDCGGNVSSRLYWWQEEGLVRQVTCLNQCGWDDRLEVPTWHPDYDEFFDKQRRIHKLPPDADLDEIWAKVIADSAELDDEEVMASCMGCSSVFFEAGMEMVKKKGGCPSCGSPVDHTPKIVAECKKCKVVWYPGGMKQFSITDFCPACGSVLVLKG